MAAPVSEKKRKIRKERGDHSDPVRAGNVLGIKETGTGESN